MQVFRPGAGHPTGTHAAPPIYADVCPAIACTYRAHAGAIFPAYECAQELNAISPLY